MKSSTLIERLTADLLARAGAIVNAGPDRTLDVLADPALRGALGLGEFERLAFEPGLAGATFIDYDAPLIDRLAAVVNGLGRVARLQPPPSARRPIDAAAMVERGVTIHNGVHRFQSHATVDTTYVGIAFEYVVLADERMIALVVMPSGNSIVRNWPETGCSANRSTPRETAASGSGGSRRRSVTCAGLGPALAVSRLSSESRRSQGSLPQPGFWPDSSNQRISGRH